jgi:hypothetical protein
VGNETTFLLFLVVVPDETVPVFALKVMDAVPLFAHAVTVLPDVVIVAVSAASNQYTLLVSIVGRKVIIFGYAMIICPAA